MTQRNTGAGTATVASSDAEGGEDLYRSMFENAVEGMYRTSPEGNYLLANPALARMHGCDSVEEFIRTFGAHNPVYETPEDRVEFARILSGQDKLHGFVCRARRLDGSVFWMMENARRLIDADGQVIGYEGTVEDISKQKQIEEDLTRAIRAAESASKVKSDFLANVGHELRTPMNSIIGFSEIILRMRQEVDADDECASYAGEINLSAQHLLEVINDILDFSELGSGMGAQRHDDVDVLALIRSAERRYQQRITDAGLTMELKLCQQSPALFGDERALRRSLNSILSNAVKFTPAGGVISIAVDIEEDDQLSITISDSGIGIQPEDIPAALSAFQQVNGSRDRIYDGMGLGLPIAKSLVEAQGGHFELQSQPGSGTMVRFTFPAHQVKLL